jgi:glycosyltransferase involved in cell wall biosynthesis
MGGADESANPSADMATQAKGERMTIYLDISAAVHRRAGLGRYAESLARALASPTLPLTHTPALAFFYNRESGIEPLAGLEHVPARTVALGYKPWRMLVWLGQLARVGFNRLVPGASLFHATEHLLLPLHGVPTVLTVHDLIFRRYPQHHKPLNRWYLNATMPLYCRRADHIIAVSEQTKRDVIAAYGAPPEKITVIYEAADERFRPQPPEVVAEARGRYRLPARYLLFVSTIEPRKNLIRLLAAFERLHAERLTDALVIVGRRGWLYDDFFAVLERSPARQAVIFPGWVDDVDLPAIYAGAQVFAFPSLFEGFGLPVLEAMACGTPVVCSNSSSLPEVGGDAALLVDPLDVDALTGALDRVLRDPARAADLRASGLAQAARFSWPRAAAETAAIYHRLIG